MAWLTRDDSGITHTGERVGQFELATRRNALGDLESVLCFNAADKDGLFCGWHHYVHDYGAKRSESELLAMARREAESLIAEGYYTADIDESAIVAAVLSTRGKNKGKLRGSRPAHGASRLAGHAYYVWRMARFHGGVDTTLPTMAGMEVRREIPEAIAKLDKLADRLARESFGSDLRGAMRWHRAFYG